MGFALLSAVTSGFLVQCAARALAGTNGQSPSTQVGAMARASARCAPRKRRGSIKSGGQQRGRQWRTGRRQLRHECYRKPVLRLLVLDLQDSIRQSMEEGT